MKKLLLSTALIIVITTASVYSAEPPLTDEGEYAFNLMQETILSVIENPSSYSYSARFMNYASLCEYETQWRGNAIRYHNDWLSCINNRLGG